MTDLQLTMSLASLGAHLDAEEWQSYLMIVETLQASGLPADVIVSTAEAYIKTRDDAAGCWLPQ
jgi:hypothetical protein